MLKVSESVNGKFDIVLSDGYKSQLHNKGKTTAKTVYNGEVQSINNSAKTRTKQQQLTQRKQKSNDKTAIVSKGKRSSRIAAHFDGRSSDKDRETLTTKNRHETMLEKNKKVDPSIPANENAAFVTKNDLASLLEVLTGSGSNDISTLLTKTKLDENKKVTSSVGKATTAEHDSIELDTQERNINQNVQQTENEVRFQSVTGPVTTQTARSTSQENAVSNTSMQEITKPTAMRSSFAVGAPGMVINDPYDDKAARHQQWIKDLDLQIREKKEREQSVKKAQSNDFISQTGTERTRVITEKTKADNPVKTVGETSHQEEQTESSGHGRGRGLMSMMVSTDEADKQRRKIFEHQKAVQLQVEDRRRQKMEERERRLREEALEDDRLTKERKQLQKQFDEELRKNREKEEQAKRRADLLEEGISKAYESAQQLKREKRRNRLQITVPEEGKSYTRRSVSSGYPNTEMFVENRGEPDAFEQTSRTRVIGKNSREQQDRNQSIPLSDNPQNQSINLNHGSSSKRSVVPPLDLSRSYSPLESKLNQNISSRISDSALEINRNSLSVRDVKTSYSEPSSQSRPHDMIHKWAEEDVGNLIDERDHVYNETSVVQFTSGEFLIPFHRTASATLMTESLSVPENGESDDISGPVGPGYNQDRDRKHVKKRRPIPEVQPTRASRLREKVRTSCEVKNSTFAARRHEQKSEAAEKTVQRQKLKQNMATSETTSRHTDGSRSSLKEKQPLSGDNKMNTTPTHLSSHYTPTPHQEKILEQLSTLRKGLLMKDQELKTRLFQINA